MASSEPKKLFKYYLDENIAIRDNRPLFFRRNMRWRVNSKEYGYPLSKKGLLRGYIKYGVFTYMAWHYFKVAITPSHHHGHHGDHHGDHHHGHDAHHGAAAPHHGHDSHAHGTHDHKEAKAHH